MFYIIRSKIIKLLFSGSDMNSEASTRLPGRPRKFESENVTDGAVALFWKKGYRATTTRELQDVLGLGQSSIYNTFGSKQELLDLVLDRYEEMTTNALLVPLRKSTDGLASIDRFFVSLKQWVTRDDRQGCMLTNIMAEDGGSTASIKQRTRSYRVRLRRELQRALQHAADNGELEKNVDPAVSARLLVGLVLGINVAARGHASDNEILRLVAAVKAMVRSWKT